MKKLFLIFAMFLFCGVSTYAQPSKVNKDLHEKFFEYNLVTVDVGKLKAKANKGEIIQLSAGKRDFAFTLTPNELRTYVTAGTDIPTYKGELVGDPEAVVRFFIGTDGKIEGLIITGGNNYIVENAKVHSKGASDDSVVIYEVSKLRNPRKVDLTNDVVRTVKQKKKTETSNPLTALAVAADFYVVEVFAVADYEFYLQQGSNAAATENKMVSAINAAEGILFNDVRTALPIVDREIWTTRDPFLGRSQLPPPRSEIARTVLETFQDHYELINPRAIPNDAAQLFTGQLAKYNTIEGGLAYFGVLCKDPAFAYSIVDSSHNPGTIERLAAHEFGHNSGANHDDAVCPYNPAEPGQVGSLMNAQGPGLFQPICAPTKSVIRTFLDTYGAGCIY